MQKTEPANNQATVIGQIAGTPAYSHTILGEDCYTMDLTCPRFSGYQDTIPVTVSGRLLDMPVDPAGRRVCVRGPFCSHNRQDADKVRVILSLHAREMGLLDGAGTDPRTNNQAVLDGYICRTPSYRKTPLGRQVTDLMLAVKRSCAWGPGSLSRARSRAGAIPNASRTVRKRNGQPLRCLWAILGWRKNPGRRRQEHGVNKGRAGSGEMPGPGAGGQMEAADP